MRAAATIRAAAAADLEALEALTGTRDRALVRLHAAERGSDTMLVAEGSGQVVGVASVRWAEGCEPPHPWLSGLHVADTLRRRGIGRDLVRALEQEAARRGHDRMTLDVDADDPDATAFYESLGYTALRPHAHRWRAIDPDSGSALDEGVAATVVMVRHLGV